MNKDSPESIIIWHKMGKSGFLPDWSICVKNACWGISRLELEHQCHGQAPAASHRTILEEKSSRTETCPGLVTTLSPLPGTPWTPTHPSDSTWASLPSMPPQHWRDSVPTALGRKKIQFSPFLQSRSQFRNGTCQKMHRASNQTCKTHFPTLENLSGCNDSCGILTGLVNWSKVCGKIYNQDLK